MFLCSHLTLTFPFKLDTLEPDSYWNNLEHRRAFLTSFAQTGDSIHLWSPIGVIDCRRFEHLGYNFHCRHPWFSHTIITLGVWVVGSVWKCESNVGGFLSRALDECAETEECILACMICANKYVFITTRSSLFHLRVLHSCWQSSIFWESIGKQGWQGMAIFRHEFRSLQ